MIHIPRGTLPPLIHWAANHKALWEIVYVLSELEDQYYALISLLQATPKR